MSYKQPRQILGVSQSKMIIENHIVGDHFVNDVGIAMMNSQKFCANICQATAVNNPQYFSKIENEKNICLNQSQQTVAISNKNFNPNRLEGMASYWPYTPFIPPFCAAPTYGIMPPAPPGLTYQVPSYFPGNPTIAPQSFENRNQLCSEMKERSSGVLNTTIKTSQSSKSITEGVSVKSEDNNRADGNLKQKQFTELTRLAMRGSETAEKIAYTHRNRPCFKKIDSLCARMKQDLIRPDGVLPNINSQGIAWAVKDFIFVFTRVINAWIIIKGYVYNTPEGLNKVKSSLSQDFLASFAIWQDATKVFVESLIKSFVSLDQLVQSQKTPFQKNENVSKPSASTPIKNHNISFDFNDSFDDPFDFGNFSTESFTTTETVNSSVPIKSSAENVAQVLNKSYYSTLIEDSEESQRKAIINGTYFKTGVYNPIWKDSLTNPLHLSEKQNPLEEIPQDFLTSSSTEESSEEALKLASNTDDEVTWSDVQKSLIFATATGTLENKHANIGNNSNKSMENDSNSEIFNTIYNNDIIDSFFGITNINNKKSDNGNEIEMINNNYGIRTINGNTKTEIIDDKMTTNIGEIINNNITNVVSFNQIYSIDSESTFDSSSSGSSINKLELLRSYCPPINGEGDGKLYELEKRAEEDDSQKKLFEYNFKVLETNVSKFSNSFNPAVIMPIEQDTVEKLEILLQKIQNLPEGNLFFEERFMKNYFPDFMENAPKFLDLRSIFMKAQLGGYAHIKEFVHDLQLITYYVKVYLKNAKHEMLEVAIQKYELAILQILSDEIFKDCNFDLKVDANAANKKFKE